ncbi:MAG: right-handed parallel beta-helix repeat-containing protein, partial [Clostridiales bacterium]|nr:right-handed parallel beta-helix repeat-containing protein [Clostridiales bacterium]
LCSIPAYAADYYISPSGNNSNPGTSTSPWQSIAKANGKVKAGDTVYLRSGSYDEMIAPGKSGEPNAYITYKAFPGEKPIIDRSRVLTGWHHLGSSIYWAKIPSWSGGVWEDNYEVAGYYCSYWPQENLSGVNGPGKFYIDQDALRVYVWTKNGDDPSVYTMRTSVGHGAGGFSFRKYITVDGIQFHWVKYGVKLADCSYCIFTNINIRYAAGYGIFLSGQSHHNKVTKNTIFHVGSWYWDEGDGIYLNGHHNLVDGNDISVTGHNPIGTRGDVVETYNNIIQNNKVYKSGSSGLNANVNTHHEVWRDNISHENTGAGFQSDSSNNMIYRNIFYRNALAISLYTTNGRTITGNKLFHNTCFNNNHASNPSDFDVQMAEWGGVCDANIFKNNIFYNTSKKYLMFFDGSNLKNNYFADNDFFGGSDALIRVTAMGIKPLSSWQKHYSTNFGNNQQDDPLFMNAVGDDFKLVPGSKCIDHGSFLTKTVGSGNGRLITVKDVGYFCDGFGIIDGDRIQLEGSTELVHILKVDYDKQQVEIDKSISWTDGTGMSFVYNGSAPDIGALESAKTQRTPAGLVSPQILNLH